MASIPGVRFNITGASGTQGLLTPESSWRCYVFPRGAWAAQGSAGTLITFDTSAIAGRFAANDWIQVGINSANLRRVSAVGGNSLAVSGSAVTVATNDRIFLIGTTQPTVSGGSATYLGPRTAIYDRDDDASTRQTNSMVTTDSNGLISFYATPGLYDCFVQDGNGSAQGYIADLPVGVAEAVSTSYASVFGATVTINAGFGVTGSVVIAGATSNLTVANNLAAGGNLSVTGIATITGTGGGLTDLQGRVRFGSTATFSTNAGMTGSLTVDGQFTAGLTTTLGAVSIGNTLTLSGAILGGVSVSSGIFGVSNQPRVWLANGGNQSVTSGTTLRLTWNTELFDVGNMHTGSSSTIVVVDPGLYLFIGHVEWAAIVGATGTNVPYTVTIQKNNNALYKLGEVIVILGVTNIGPKQAVSGMDLAVAGDYYDLAVTQLSGTTQTVTCTAARVNTQFQAVKLF